MCNENLSLFAAEESDLKRQLAARLNELAGVQLYVGTAHGNMKVGLAACINLNATPAEVNFQKHGSNETA
jgi:hypothetical protein